MIGDKVFLVGFQNLSALQIVARHPFNDKTAFKGAEVVVDRIQVNPAVLALKVISDPFRRKTAADIVEHKARNPFQQLDIAYAEALYGVAQKRRRVDVTDNSGGVFKGVIGRMNSGKPAKPYIIMQFLEKAGAALGGDWPLGGNCYVYNTKTPEKSKVFMAITIKLLAAEGQFRVKSS